MSTLFWCLFLATIMPFLLASYGSYLRYKNCSEYDNNYPRQQVAKLTGLGARVYAAQQNCWEALMAFTPAALVVSVTGNAGSTAAILAVIFIIARLLYIACYVANQAGLRSLMFGIGLACTIALFLQAV